MPTNRFSLRKQRTMKQIFSSVLFLFFLANLPAQTPLYIQFDPSCMYQLEYKYTYSGQDLLMYSINKGENELYFFKIGSNPQISTQAMPKGMVSCQTAVLNSTEVNSINAGGRLAYIVHKVQNGYISMPVDAVGQIFRVGTSYVFRSPSYDFLLDTTNIDYARNLSQPGVASPVYLTGMRDYDCRRQYAFRLEPLTSDLPRMDVELIPGIGLVSNRTGHNGSEMEQNVYRLTKINGIGMEEYITALCRNISTQTGNPGSFITGWTPDPDPAHNEPYLFTEPDKEEYYTQPTASGGQQAMANCPEKPGIGYHIVQPGESLNSIARTYKLDTKSLIDWNRLKDPNKLEVCQKIWLSPGKGNESVNYSPKDRYYERSENTPKSMSGASAYYSEHIVQKGESITAISRKYGASEAEVRRANNMPATGDIVIYPGQRVLVPKPSSYDNPVGSGDGRSNVMNYNPGSASSASPASYTPTPGTGATARVQHLVGKNETVAMLARKYGYTTEYFRHINRNVKTLPQGDEQVIPQGLFLYSSDCSCDRPDLKSFGNRGDAPAPEMRSQGQGFYYDNNNRAGSTPFAGAATVQFEYVGEYIVKTGDTMQSIANTYNLSVEKLAAANKMLAGQEPQPRDILKIPK
jgi:LysM repeat protein